MEDGTSERIGPYRLLRELGRGGQAVVYLAVDERLDRPVALKVLPAHRGGDLVARRFHREAMVASRLDHPGICPVFDAGTTDGQAFIAMRYVEGVSLSNWMTQSRPAVVSVSDDFRESLEEDSVVATPPTETPASSPPSSARRIAEVLSVVGKLASAAHAAHEVGIVHRDLKPGNVILTTSGQPVILDFGLAGDLDDDLSSLTRSGDLLGTPAYMSPEQLAGHHIQLDRRTDVWSLGVMLYEALVGRRPFESPTREGLYQAILTKDPVDPRSLAPRIAPDLSVVVATALAKDRDRRYQSAAALAEDLRRVADEEPILAKPLPLLGRLGRWARRHPAISILSVLLTVSLVSALVLAVAFAQRQARTAETERRARIETLDLLAHSRLDQSVLARRSGVSGRRSSGLALTRSIRALQEDALRLGAAREIGPTLTALRSEVIALLQIGDAELVRRSMPPLALGGHLSPDGDYILLLVRRPDEAEMRVQLFDLERSATMGEPGEPTEMPAAAALGPEGTSFAMMQRVGSPLIVRDGIGARVRRELELPSVVAEAKPISLTFASSGRRVFGVFQLPDGGSVLVGFDVVGSSPPWTFSSARAIERFAISETRVATLDSQGAMCALDPRDGSLQQTYAAPDGVIEAIALSATGGLYRARRRSDGDLAIERLDAPGGFAIDPALAAIGRLAVSDDGRRVAYSVSPPQIRVHDLTSGSALAVIRSPHAGAVRNLMWRRDGLLASRGALGELATWRIVESEAVESIAVRSASGEPIRCTKLGVDPTSERVAISPPTGSALHLLERTGSVTTLDVAVPDMPGVTRFHQLTFSPDGGRLLCVHMRRASVIDLSGKTATVHRDGDETTLFTSGALDVEGRAVVAGTEGGRALLWDLDTGDRLPVAEQAASAMISEDGRRVATIRLPASLQNVSVDDRDGRPERPAFRTEEFTSGTPLLQWYMFGSGRLASTSHGNLQGFGVDTGTFVLWDLERGHKRLELPILLEEVPTAFSHDPSGDLWAMGSSKGRVTVYDLRRAEQLFSWDLETESVTDLAFRSDGAVLYASDSSATLRRLDLAALRDALAQLDLAW